MDGVKFLYSNKPVNEVMKKLLIWTRLYYPYNLWFMRRMRRMNPPHPIMQHAREFFLCNAERVEAVCGWLSDRKSVDTYRKVICMRQYYRKEDIPHYNYNDQYFPNDIPEFSKKWGGWRSLC